MPSVDSQLNKFNFKKTPDGNVAVYTETRDINPTALADALRAKELENQKEAETKVENITTKIAQLSTLELLVRNFQNINQTLANTSRYTDIFQRVIPQTNSDLLNVSAVQISSFLNQSFDVEVLQLAKKDIISSKHLFTDLTSSASFDKDLFINGVSISFDTTDSLNNIIQKINAQKNTTGVEASYAHISNEDGYALKLISTRITTPIDLHGTDADHFSDSGFNFSSSSDFEGNSEKLLAHKKTLQAQIKIDGITYYRDQNVIQDVIDGLTFTLKGVTSTQLTFKADSDEVLKQINNWTDSIKNLKEFLKTQRIKEQKDTTLYGETIIDKTLEIIHQISKGAKGIPLKSRYDVEFSRFEFTQIVDNNSQIVSTDAYAGDLTFDAVKLKEKVYNDPKGIAKMLGNYCEHNNPSLRVIKYPITLSKNIAGQDTSLLIKNTGPNSYEATLTCGDYTETVESDSTIFEFKEAFKGVQIQHTQGVATTETTSLKFTQGIASILSASFNDYLSGILAQTKTTITREKSNLTQQTNEAKEKAQREYDKSMQGLLRFQETAAHTKMYTKMLSGLRGGKKND